MLEIVNRSGEQKLVGAPSAGYRVGKKSCLWPLLAYCYPTK